MRYQMRRKYSAVAFFDGFMVKNYFKYIKIDLNGERIISSLKVWRPKYEAPILAETRKNTDTQTIDRYVNIQEMGSTNLTRFNAGDFFSGYLDHQYRGRYRDPGAQVATVPRP